MIRKIVHIDEELCNGCGLCIDACHECAIELVDGKARLVSDKYCDGLGDCLPACPTGAIKIIERKADAFDEEAVKLRMAEKKKEEVKMPCGCPGTLAKKIERKVEEKPVEKEVETNTGDVPSYLSQWPIQLRLINPQADYLENADILFAADCTAFSYGNFHKDFIKGRITIIACPKLDDNNYNVEKITEILRLNNVKSITVAKMVVPCCTGLATAVKQAMLNAEKIVPYREVTITTTGEIRE